MSKKANQIGRKKKKDNKKNTEKLFGKFSKRSIRIKQQQIENEEKNKKKRQAELLNRKSKNINKRKSKQNSEKNKKYIIKKIKLKKF